MRRLAFGALLLLFAQAAAEQGASGPSPTPPPARSGVAPRIFGREVSSRLICRGGTCRVRGLTGVALKKAHVVQTTAQYVLLVDRSPKVHPHQGSVAGVLPLDGRTRRMSRSSTTTRTSARAREPQAASVPPGEILEEEFLRPLGISQYRLAKALTVPPRRINEIVHGKRAMTADTALRLGRHFGNSERFWLNLQVRYDLEIEKDRLGDRLRREVRVASWPAGRRPGHARSPAAPTRCSTRRRRCGILDREETIELRAGLFGAWRGSTAPSPSE